MTVVATAVKAAIASSVDDVISIELVVQRNARRALPARLPPRQREVLCGGGLTSTKTKHSSIGHELSEGLRGLAYYRGRLTTGCLIRQRAPTWVMSERSVGEPLFARALSDAGALVMGRKPANHRGCLFPWAGWSVSLRGWVLGRTLSFAAAHLDWMCPMNGGSVCFYGTVGGFVEHAGRFALDGCIIEAIHGADSGRGQGTAGSKCSTGFGRAGGVHPDRVER